MKINHQHELSFEDLIHEVMAPAINNADTYHLFVTAAIKTQELDQNAVMWAKIAEALVKSYLLENPDGRVLSDRFILQLGMSLSDHFTKHIIIN